MRKKKAKQLAKIAGVSLKNDSSDKDHGATATDSQLIAQIHPDGTITEREKVVVEARTTENRYLYRQLKKIYTGTKMEPSIQKKIKEDLRDLNAELTAKTNETEAVETNGGSNE